MVFADPSVRAGANWVTGANRPDLHVTGANLDRDFRVDRWEDLVQIREGDRCPIDGGELEIGRSIVVGHIYQLGTRYSEPLGTTFQDEDGIEKPYRMGSYGIGITRILAALVEQHHDDDGIVWPKHVAPFQVVVVLATQDDPAAVAEAERIYEGLGGRRRRHRTGRPRSARRREVRRRRPDRLSGAGHDRQARPRQRHRGPEAAGHGGAIDGAARATPCRPRSTCSRPLPEAPAGRPRVSLRRGRPILALVQS